MNEWAAILTRGDGSVSDLELAKASLNLRNAALEIGLPDQYLPTGRQLKPSQDDINAAEATATAIRESIEAANGDSKRFCQEMEARLLDTGLPTTGGRRYF